MDLRGYEKDGMYNATDIWVPGCTFQKFCVRKDGAMTHFCHCLQSIGAQEQGSSIKIRCDLLEVIDE